MESSIFRQIVQLTREHKTAARATAIFLCLALVVAAVTMGVLTSTGHAMTQKVKVLTCPLEVHEHTPECRNEKGDLICGYADYVVHIHNDDCYGEDGALVCTLREVWPHTHQDSCYEELRSLICGQEEAQPHAHTEACYARERGELLCTQTEHTHGPDCYLREEVLTCDKTEQEHVHSDDCYTVSRELSCGLEESEEHTHADSCYTEVRTLICDKTTEPHVHGPECYTVNETLTCTIPEHTHADDCYAWTETLICDIPEGQIPEGGHVHTDACYETSRVLSCGQLENHEHTEDCFEHDDAGNRVGDPICGQIELLEHVHGEDCFTIEERVVEDETPETGPFFFETTGEDPEVPAKEYICGLEEHSHDESCRNEAGEIVCGLEEHTHDENCLAPAPEAEEAPAPEYICGKEEHVHDESCLNEEGGVICGKQAHTHNESCLAPEAEVAEEPVSPFICGQEEHLHSVSCLNEAGEPVCGLEEHVHDASCLAAPENGGAKVYRDNSVLITAVYPAEAMLPEDVTLRATRLTREENLGAYENYLEQMQDAAGDLDLSTVVLYDIGFYTADDQEIEPQATVNVSIQFLDESGLITGAPLTVVHFGAEGATVLESVTEGDSVSFETDSFSPFSFLTATFGAAKPIANGSGSKNLEDYIQDNKMVLQKWDPAKKDRVDVPDGEKVVLGNNYRLKVRFQPKPGESFVSPMTWDLGDSVKCEAEPNGVVYAADGTTQNGTYKLTEDGKLEVTFNEDFLKNADQSLDMTFEFVPTENPEGGSSHYPWEGHIGDHQVLKDHGTLDVEKEAGWYDNDSGSIHYTVTASVTEGMIKDGKLVDKMGDGLTFLKMDYIRIYDTDGRDVTSSYQEYIDKLMAQGNHQAGQTEWTLEPLPPLTQGMKLEMRYYGQVGTEQRKDMTYTAENTVTFSGKMPNGELSNTDSQKAEKPLARDQLAKLGNVIKLNANGTEEEVIQWTVQVGSGQWDPLSTQSGGKQDLTMVDTLGDGLSFRTGEPFTVNWCDKDGNIRSAQITWGENGITVSEDGKVATYKLTKDLFTGYNWQDGDYLQVVYNTDFDKSEQPRDGFENTIKNEILGTDGTTGRLPVGESIQKTVVDHEEDGYLIYTVVADVPAAGYMKSMKGDKDDGHPDLDLPYFYIQDELDFGDNYFALNKPEVISVVAQGSENSYTFERVAWNDYRGPDYSGETYDIIDGPNNTDNKPGKLRRTFRIFFNTAKYGTGTPGSNDGLEKHDSIWDIQEDTRLIITYKIPYDTPLVKEDGTDAGKTLGEVLNAGYQLENKALYRRSGVDDLNYSCFLDKNPTDEGINKAAQVLDGGVVEYRVRFANVERDGVRPINDEGDTHFNKMKPTFTDTFDERMEYVEGSLHVEVYNSEGEKLYAKFNYIGPEEDLVKGNTLTADMIDNTIWSNNQSPSVRYDGNAKLTDTFNTDRYFVITYQLRLKEDYRKDLSGVKDIKNEANLQYGGTDHKDDATVNIPGDMLQKSFRALDNNQLEYTLKVNDLAIDLVTPEGSGDQKVNPNSYKLVDSMSDNLRILTNDKGEFTITVQYRDEDGKWQDLTRSSSSEGISKKNLNYFLGSEEGNDIYFILPDELAIQIVYTVRVYGDAASQVIADNTATLYADRTETDEKRTVYEVGGSSAQADGKPPVYVEKQDADSDSLLEGAKFALYTDQATEGEKITVTGKKGEITLFKVWERSTNERGRIEDENENTNILPVDGDEGNNGLYVLIETAAPDGYQLDPTPHFFRFPGTDLPKTPETVTYNGQLYPVEHLMSGGTIVIENTQDDYELPESGGSGLEPLYAVGIAMMALSAVLLLETKQRRRKGET